ncbi:MAG: hypothetical protein JKY96_04765 [Phycisphaerales bacterium]|nr:hypothetical protein [Phycisphaerales bacterium]
MRSIVICGFVLLGMVSQAVAENYSVSRHILDLLECKVKPNPTLSFSYLQKEGVIGTKIDPGSLDGVSCFKTKSELLIEDLVIEAVCGYSSDQISNSIRPGLYGQPTIETPEAMIGLVSNQDFEMILNWSERFMPDAPKSIGTPYLVPAEGKTMIMCEYE